MYKRQDIRKNAAEGKISGMLTIEEGGCCKGSLGVLRRLYELGVRMMTLTWNHENELAQQQHQHRQHHRTDEARTLFQGEMGPHQVAQNVADGAGDADVEHRCV